MNHASLKPVTSLMKSEDFLGKEALSVEHGGGGGGRSATVKRPPHMTMKVGLVDNFCCVFLIDKYRDILGGFNNETDGM